MTQTIMFDGIPLVFDEHVPADTVYLMAAPPSLLGEDKEAYMKRMASLSIKIINLSDADHG